MECLEVGVVREGAWESGAGAFRGGQGDWPAEGPLQKGECHTPMGPYLMRFININKCVLISYVSFLFWILNIIC